MIEVNIFEEFIEYSNSQSIGATRGKSTLHCSYVFDLHDKAITFIRKNIRNEIKIEAYKGGEYFFSFSGCRILEAKKRLKLLAESEAQV
jgi:uncharacterized ParB-like nuclease family protein